WRAIARRGITLLRLDGKTASDNTSWEGWAAWVAAILKSGKLSVLAAELEKARPGLACTDLPKLGEQLLANLQNPGRTPAASNAKGLTRGTATAPDKSPGGATKQRADLAHRATQAGLLMEGSAKISHLNELADKLAEQPAEVLELLERIDDLVFGAISGDHQALAELEVLWPMAASQLDETLVEQSREQYLRCALSICSDFAEGGVQRPERALSAVDVLCVLFEE
ncbi:MAG: hypothetical protein WDZ48_02365, partial [Pirellulales bacterium]